MLVNNVLKCQIEFFFPVSVVCEQIDDETCLRILHYSTNNLFSMIYLSIFIGLFSISSRYHQIY